MVEEEIKGPISSGSNEATQVYEEIGEEVTSGLTSGYTDSSQEAQIYEEAIIYIAKTNIEKIGGRKLQNAYEINPNANRVSSPDGHFYLKGEISSGKELIPNSDFRVGVQLLEGNSRVLIEVKTKLPSKLNYKKSMNQIQNSYTELEKLNEKLDLPDEIINSSIGNYLIVFNGTNPLQSNEYFEYLIEKLNVKVQKIIGIIYCTRPVAISISEGIKMKKAEMAKEVIKNKVIEEMKEERDQFDKQVIEEMKKREQFAKQVIEEMKKREQFAEQVIEETKKREQFAKQVIEEMKKREQFAEQVIEETKKREQFGKQIEVNQMQLAKQIEEAKQLAKQIEEANQVAKQIANQKQMWSKKVKYKKK